MPTTVSTESTVNVSLPSSKIPVIVEIPAIFSERQPGQALYFFSLRINFIAWINNEWVLDVTWSQPSGPQTASVNRLTTLTDNRGNVYELVRSEGVPLGTYENRESVPLPEEGVVHATLYFRLVKGEILKTVENLTVQWRDVYVKDRVWIKTFPINVVNGTA